MGCNSPILMKDKQGNTYEVPCRKCLGCRKASITQWSNRIKWEVDKYYKEYGVMSSFITLTYRESDCPIDMSLKKKDLIDFIKRLRKKTDIKIKTAHCGEYGGMTSRPHYHLIGIGVSPNRDREIKEIWGKGEIKTEVANPKNIRYVIKYIMKQQTEDELSQMYDDIGLERPFVGFSKHMGEDFMIEHYEEIKEKGGIQYGKAVIGIPLYYRQKMGITKQEIKETEAHKKLMKSLYLEAKERGLTIQEYEKIKRNNEEIALRVQAQQKGEKAVWNVSNGNLVRPLTKDKYPEVERRKSVRKLLKEIEEENSN